MASIDSNVHTMHPTPGTKKKKFNWPRAIRSACLYTTLIVLSVLFLLPFYILIRNGLMTKKEITAFDWIWLPAQPSLTSLRDLFGDPLVPVLNSFKNSTIISVIQVSGQMLLASMAGYGLARIPYRWRDQVFYVMLLSLMVPAAVTFIPTYVVAAQLHLVNTLPGIILPGLFNVFSAFLFRQFYLDFPVELEEAGRVDGLGYMGSYWHLVLPNSLGILMSLSTIAFITSWNNFLWPLLIGQGPEMWTIQVALSTFMTAQTINLPAVFMGATLSVLPPFVLFLFLQRYIVEGIKLSGTKG